MEPRWLIQPALMNAAMVVLLAAVALFVGRRLRRPAITHGLWVLVLIKLMTPPLIGVPVPGEWFPESWTGFARTYLAAGAAEPVGQLPAGSSRHGAMLAHSVGGGEFAAVPGLSAAPIHPAADDGSHSLGGAGGVLDILWCIWLFGTCAYFLGIAARIVHFSLRLRTGVDRVDEADLRAAEIGRGLGLRRIPSVTFIAQPCSPMLWGLGRFTRIVFPAALWNQLPLPCRDALLTHELAHYRRRDHWVRPLEILVTGLFWWHPVVWWARREIEAAEEECCDAWVVRESSIRPRTYAEALLATVDYIASASPSTVPATTGIGGAPDLQHRLTRIMRPAGSPRLPDFGRWLLCAAGLLLPLHPFIADPASATTITSSAGDSAAYAVRPLVMDTSPLSPPRMDAHHPQDNWIAPSGWWTGSPEERWAVAESADGRFRLLAAAGNRVFLEDRHTGRRADLGAEQINSAAFAPDSRHFVTGSVNGTVRLWEAISGEAQSFLGLHDAEVVTVAVAPSGQFAVSGSRDGALLIWDLGSGVAWATWTDSRRPIVSVRVASDDRTIAVASGDWRSGEPARITLLTLDSGSIAPAASLGLPESVAAIEFTDGDNALLAAGWDGAVVRWDLRSRDAVPEGNVDRSVVNAATFSPDVRFADQIRRPSPPFAAEWTQIDDGLEPFRVPTTFRGQSFLPVRDTSAD